MINCLCKLVFSKKSGKEGRRNYFLKSRAVRATTPINLVSFSSLALVRWAGWAGLRAGLDCSREAHPNWHTWRGAWGHARACSNRRKTGTKHTHTLPFLRSFWNGVVPDSSLVSWMSGLGLSPTHGTRWLPSGWPLLEQSQRVHPPDHSFWEHIPFQAAPGPLHCSPFGHGPDYSDPDCSFSVLPYVTLQLVIAWDIW